MPGSRWRRPWIRTVVHGGAVVVLTLHAALAAAALWLLPQGAEPWSGAWVVDSALPIGAAALLALVVVAFVFFKRSALGLSLACAAVAGAWLGAAGAGAALLPISIGVERAIGPGAIGLSLAALAWACRLRAATSLFAFVVGVVAGAAEIGERRAAPPATRPAGGEIAAVTGAPAVDDAASGQVSFPCGKEHVRLAPLLVAEGVTADGAWPALAAATGATRRGFEAFAREKSGFRARYGGDDGAASVVATKDARGLDVEAVAIVPRAVTAQRALFAAVHVPFAAKIVIAPLGKEPIVPDELGHRAWYGRDMQLHLARPAPPAPLRAPFEEIARAPLGRDEPLVVEVQHREGPGSCRLVFRDWTSQLATEPSPIAPIAQNALLLAATPAGATMTLLLADGPHPAAITLAPGAYKNRVRVDTTMSPGR